MTPAIRANTKKGAAFMVTSTILRKTSLTPSISTRTGSAFSLGIITNTNPKKMPKKMTCSMSLLSVNALKILSGTMSTRNCRGPASENARASSIFSATPALLPSAATAARMELSTMAAYSGLRKKARSSNLSTPFVFFTHTSYFSLLRMRWSSEMALPGFAILTSNKPMPTAATVVRR